MKINSFILWVVLFPLLLFSCGKGNPSQVITPPPINDGTEKPSGEDPGEDPGDDPGEDPGEDPGDDKPDHSGPWDVNRGKEVVPKAGNGWTVTKIDDGITYYAFSGTESITNAKQRIFVTDIDLNNTNYEVKLAYYDSRNTCSNVFRSKGALAAINASYERTSVFIRYNGVTQAQEMNATITDTGVPNWKNEGGVYLDGKQDVRIEYTGKDMTLYEQYLAYRKKAKTELNIVSSAPMLIDDYEPVGETFCQRHPKQSSSSEDPYNHQSSKTNPRTAIAKTEFNHVLFIVVDGRRNVSRGISAAELTKFLVTNFNPQYAINLDGGGSATMCVKGQGDPTTNVVNYPVDSDQVDPKPGAGDHTGERSVPTFFYVVKK